MEICVHYCDDLISWQIFFETLMSLWKILVRNVSTNSYFSLRKKATQIKSSTIFKSLSLKLLFVPQRIVTVLILCGNIKLNMPNNVLFSITTDFKVGILSKA